MNFLAFLDILGLVLFALYVVQQTASALMRPRRIPHSHSGVHVTFLIPALNEAQVIEATLQNVRNVAPDTRVIVIDDASDDGTDRIVQAFAQRDPGVRLLRREFPEARQNKGRAMNWAVTRLLAEPEMHGQDLTQHVFVGLDADGRLGGDFVPQVRGAFQDPHVLAAQGWMRYRQTTSELPGLQGALARVLLIQQDLENFILGHYQRVRHWAGTASLTGNGQCMRASYVAGQLARGVEPWPDVLLEDFGSALEIRLHDPRARIALLTAHVGQQGMISPVPFMRQRARWIQGTMQCLRYLGRLWGARAHPVTLADFTYLILGPWLNTLMIISLLSQPLRRAFGWHGFTSPAWVATVFTLLPLAFQLNWALRYRAERRLPLWVVGYIMLTLPVFSAITLWSLPLALFNHFTGRRGWYKSVRHDEPTDGTLTASGTAG
ncbi:glycosyltransferase family 2 protein [Deinococcus soli (ex Cha et al. 2016)]|uniref:Glycosyl transferase n=1 Tax=Deinococcus soli (ex Cha et al. 2016) TaxID=1309411 RepID=A0A0F7JNX6_9DEIO|nr:glycosyltransferase family 2 protein [Deinococcus soli (ex Cha et al. 2016)]AKH18081.1 glycosyl transferase [Deinococcus soli (ex Cha et al. 2016)]